MSTNTHKYHAPHSSIIKYIYHSRKIMNPEKQRKLQEYTRAIAEILYTEAESEQQFTLEIIEKTIQTQLASVCQS